MACTDYAVVHAVDELVWTSTVETQDLARQVMADLIGPFAREIADADLVETDSKQVETAVNGLHIVCALCAAVLEAVDAVHELTDALADEIADQILDVAGKGIPLSPLAQAAVRAALRSTFGATATMVGDPVRLRMLQLVGYATCPDVSDHPEVQQYCVKPLTDDLVTTAMEEWMSAGFPADATVLGRAKARRKS